MRTLTQGKNRKKIDRYPYERELTREEKMGRAINRLRFKSRVWDAEGFANYDYIYEMVCAARQLAGLEKMNRELFNDGIQYCKIFAYNYDYALQEFKALCWGDW